MDFSKITELCGSLKTALADALPAEHTNVLSKIISGMCPREFVELEQEYSAQSEALIQGVLKAVHDFGLGSQVLQSALQTVVPKAHDSKSLLIYYYALCQLCAAQRVYESLMNEPDLLDTTMLYLDRIQSAYRVSLDAQPAGVIEWPFASEPPLRSGAQHGVVH
ncbi:hypothetical protein [Pseudoalteromonas rubra]|uniref:hypothetical protein n=1 Tax=Pseudoalteromonas rubra TaxID=43658 RepID=UPI002DB6FE52|nr:hypothetical protein [Pseudoalteromonas rubra]MEC4091909.1 hypothetical protein [Pseudoalteromonas rubra]